MAVHCVSWQESLAAFFLGSEDLGEDELKDYRLIILVGEISEQRVTSKLWRSYCFLLLVTYTVRESRKITCNLVRLSLKLHTEQEKAATTVKQIRTIKEKWFTLHWDCRKCATMAQTHIKKNHKILAYENVIYLEGESFN